MSIACVAPMDELTALSPRETMLTLDEVAQRFRVSTKTVRRWRRYGLISQRFVLDGRRRVGFLQSTVDCFLVDNEDRIRRSTRFSRMADEERKTIIDRMRLLAQAGGRLTEVARQIAQETGRDVQTIRYTLRCFDPEHLDMPLLPHSRHPLQIEAKTEIYQQYRRGASVTELSQRFDQTRSYIYHIINDMNVARIMELPLDYIGNEQFAGLSSEEEEREILRTLPKSDAPAKTPRIPSGLPAYVAGLYEVPLLTREQELHLFRKMNYLKYKASTLRAQLNPNRPRSRLMQRIETLYDESVATTTQIVCANLRLVVSIVKRYVRPTQGFFELVSDGNVSLLRAVSKFDYSRGNRFSTYATWAIMKNFSRTFSDANRHHERFRTSQSDLLACAEDKHTGECEQEAAQIQRESQVKSILERLGGRERQIIMARFGLIGGHAPLSLKQVGSEMGVTKERVRQLEARAIGALRAAAKQSRIEYTV